jgi:alkylation response protein AidB-like acyl-CoA dehydrogenase
MNTSVENELTDIVSAASRFFGQRTPATALRDQPTRSTEGFDRSIYTELADLDYFRLAVPEEDGGLGFSEPASGMICEAAGRELLPGPLLDQLVAIEIIRNQCGSQSLVDRLMSGDAIASTVFVTDTALRFDVEANQLSGHLNRIGFGDQVDLWILVVENTDGEADICIVDPMANGIKHDRVVRSLDETWYGIESDVRQVAPTAVFRASTPHYARFLGYARGMVASYSIGACGRLLDDTVEYVSQRHQFGQPVGSFQAIKHKAADCYIAFTHARDLTRIGVARKNARQLGLARLAADACYRRTAEASLQMYGGMGYTVETLVHLYLKNAQRLRTWPTNVCNDVEKLRTELCLDA